MIAPQSPASVRVRTQSVVSRDSFHAPPMQPSSHLRDSVSTPPPQQQPQDPDRTGSRAVPLWQPLDRWLYFSFFVHVLRVFAGDVRAWLARVSYELNECKLEADDESATSAEAEVDGAATETAGESDARSIGSHVVGFENLNFELESVDVSTNCSQLVNARQQTSPVASSAPSTSLSPPQAVEDSTSTKLAVPSESYSTEASDTNILPHNSSLSSGCSQLVST